MPITLSDLPPRADVFKPDGRNKIETSYHRHRRRINYPEDGFQQITPYQGGFGPREAS